MYHFENVLDEIEKNIDRDIDVKDLAQKANLSVYEFRRIFSFITKISFGEYVRKRRLSLAAIELYKGKENVTNLAGKFGYDSPSAFSRAFKDFHGISPSGVIKGNTNFKLFTRINTQVISTGGKDVSYTIFEKKKFKVSGFLEKSAMTDTECCEDVWNKFNNSKYAEKIYNKADKIYVAYDNGVDFVNCCIGTIDGDFDKGIEIAESKWACFKISGTDDEYVNRFYNDILNQWFSSSGYIKNNNVPNIEVFPSCMEEDVFDWEIWIPIKENAEI